MKNVFILFIASLLLSLTPSAGKKLSKEILGRWVLRTHLENGDKTAPFYVKTQQEDNSSNGFEFLKTGEVIVNMSTTFSENEIIKGSWVLFSDSTVSVMYKYASEIITEQYLYSEKPDGEYLLKWGN